MCSSTSIPGMEDPGVTSTTPLFSIGRLVISLPLTLTCPPSGLVRPAAILRKGVLPEPFLPAKQTNPPSVIAASSENRPNLFCTAASIVVLAPPYEADRDCERNRDDDQRDGGGDRGPQPEVAVVLVDEDGRRVHPVEGELQDVVGENRDGAELAQPPAHGEEGSADDAPRRVREHHGEEGPERRRAEAHRELLGGGVAGLEVRLERLYVDRGGDDDQRG